MPRHPFYSDAEILHFYHNGLIIEGAEARLMVLDRRFMPRDSCRDTDLERERTAQLDYSKESSS